MPARNSREQAVDIATLYDVNQDHEIVLREALVVNQTQAMKKEYQLGFKKLLDAQKESEERLKSLENEVKETGKRASRKRERSPVPEFKYKRDKIQFDINKSVMEKIENALDMSDDEERRATLNEGKDMLVQRNKHKTRRKIRLGNRRLLCGGAISYWLRRREENTSRY